MRHLQRTRRLGVKAPHRLAMLRNLTRGLIEHGRIKTTVARAKSLRPFVEKLVTRSKDPTVHNIRMAVRDLHDTTAVMNLVKTVAPQFKDRNGGYTRIMRLSKARAGDAADMALIEWVEDSLVGAYQEVAPKKAAKKPAKKTPAKKAKAEDETAEKKAPKKAAKK